MASFLGDSNKTMTEIRSDLVCQMCERPGKKRWFRCLNLHQICPDCKRKEQCCCGQPFSNKYEKTTEKMLNAVGMKYNCANAKNGCQEVLAESALDDHVSECIYRSVPCLKNNLSPPSHRKKCREKVTFREVIQHYEKHKKAKLEELDLKIKHTKIWSQELSLSGRNCYWDPVKFTLNNQTFLLAEKTEDKVVYMWIYILGSPKDAKHFSFTLNFYGKNAALSFKGKVAAIDESFETLSKAGKCFAYDHKSFLAQVLDEENKYEYSLEIRNLKEEA